MSSNKVSVLFDLGKCRNLKGTLDTFLEDAKNEDLCLPISDEQVSAIQLTVDILARHIESLEDHIGDCEKEEV